MLVLLTEIEDFTCVIVATREQAFGVFLHHRLVVVVLAVRVRVKTEEIVGEQQIGLVTLGNQQPENRRQGVAQDDTEQIQEETEL